MSTATQTTPDALAQRLAGSGLRSTPQRELVYEALLKKRDHPTADEVFARVNEALMRKRGQTAITELAGRSKPEKPAISIATVYNCLETLVQCGLVRAVNFERTSTRYCPNLTPHAHFHDDETGATLDVDLPPSLLADLKSALPPGLEASAVEITFRGSGSRKATLSP